LARVAGEVVLVGHSYGGAVVGGAAPRVATVRHVVYVTAFALGPDETVSGIAGGVPAPTPRLRDAMVVRDDGICVLDPDIAPDALYGCCSPAAVAAALPRLTPHALSAFGQAPGASPLGAIPTTYVRCTLDRAIPIEQQDHMAARCDDVVTIATDHSPMLSATGQLVDVLAGLAQNGAA
ncbi:MAG TPA: alpha/beta hydrolase, partial [Ilumatobacteraceae bacterium]